MVASPEEIPNDRQMLDAGCLVPFDGDTMLTIDSPFFVAGADKVKPRHAPSVGQHSDEILREAGYDEAAIQRLALRARPLPDEARMSTHILTEVADGILRIQIDRPDKKNALTVAMYAELAAALERAASEPAVRVVLIHGHPQVFTSGNDLGRFHDPPPPDDEDRPVLRFLRAISSAPKPIVAAVTGPAVGVGTTMLLHCDLVYAGEGARFQLPFVNLGLVPEAGSSLLCRPASAISARPSCCCSASRFRRPRRRQYGIVTEVVADGAALETATAAAQKLAAKPPAAIRLTKMLMKQGAAAAVAKQMQEEGEHFGRQLGSPEAAEAFKAFAEKRAPDFSRFS